MIPYTLAALRDRLGFVCLTFCLCTTAGLAQDRAAEVTALREQVRLQEEQLRLLGEKVRLLEERLAPSTPARPAADAPPAPAFKPSVVTVTDRNINLTSGDGLNFLRFRSTIHLDSRSYFDDEGGGDNDAFLIRRARVSLEGALNRLFQFQVMSEFGGSSASLNVANITAAFSPQFQLKAGRFKTILGLEHQQSSTASILFVERSLVTSLLAGTDVGIQLSGESPGGLVQYGIGIFNGTADGTTSNNTDTDDDKAYVGRVMLQPVEGLLFGVGGSYTPSQSGAAGLPTGYRSEGQQRIFAYNTGTVADGTLWRITPQGYYYRGPFGFMGEYAISSTDIRAANGVSGNVRHDAWQLSLSYVLTGEDATYTGVLPSRKFDPAAGTWGAFQVAARLSHLDLDDAAFPLFASPSANATEVDAYALGINWFLTNSVKVMVNYMHSRFETQLPPTRPLLEAGEDALFTRLQLVF